jgi:hypothetical protein
MQESSGRICPRVDLAPENEVPAELALAAVRLGADHPLWGRLFDIHADGLDREDKSALLYRVMGGAGHPDVVARMKRLRDRGKKK